MDLGEVLVVGAMKNGDLSIIKELELITNSNLSSKNKRKNSKIKNRNKMRDTRSKSSVKPNSKENNLCQSCGNYECINRRPYKTSCSCYVRCKTSRFKTFKGNHGNTGSGSRIWRE